METLVTSVSPCGQPSDITIVVDGCKFCVHKNVLIQNCDYFKAMFSSQMLENWQDEITIKLVDKKAFKILVHGFYSGHLDLTVENMYSLSAACQYLQVTPPLLTQCSDFLKICINHDHCFEVLNFTAFHPIQEVYSLARRYCLHHFLTLCKEKSFLTLPLRDMMNYLSDEHLVIDGVWEIFEALKDWCKLNEPPKLETLIELVSGCLHDKSSIDECKSIASAINCGESFLSQRWAHLGSRRKAKNIFMFWACLSFNKQRGLVDVIKLGDLESSQGPVFGSGFDKMTHIVKEPGFDLGCAVCVKGPYVYLCGGGPSFGKMNWIRDVWRFGSFQDGDRWNSIGSLPETRRYHAMVAVNRNLYIFGGFGKFRSKNSCLESFDIDRGIWESLSPMPMHEFKPVATSHHQCIYYLSQQWEVFQYSVSSDQWSSCHEIDLPNNFIRPHEKSNPCRPVAFFVNHVPTSKQESSIYFTALSTGKSVQIVSFPLGSNSCKPTSQEFDQVEYFGSCSINSNIFIFLQSRKRDEEDDDKNFEENEKEIKVMCFEPATGHCQEITKIINVSTKSSGSSIVPLPYVPKSFQRNHFSNDSKLL